jgi:hypothetical protein
MQLGDWRSFGPADTGFFDIDSARVEQWYRSNSGAFQSGGVPATLTFVHLYNPDCRCNRFVDPHLQRLIEHYASRGVRFVAAPSRPLDANSAAPLDLPAISAMQSTLVRAGVNSSPAALIFDANGRLVYYGPYSDSAWCGRTGTLVEPVLDSALSGLAQVRRPRASRGCFCKW